MACISKAVLIVRTLIFIIAMLNVVIVAAVRESELNIVFGVMRARGYHLFANAIATSDVHYDIKSNGNFTLFAPINSALFAFDMTLAATNYVSTLRYHIVPRRLSIPDLLSLPPGANSLPTLLPGRSILVEQRRSSRSLITVDRVDIVVPGMYYGTDIAVHGLEGILDLRYHSRYSPENLTGASLTNLSSNLTFVSPIMDLSSNQTSKIVYPNAHIPHLPPLNSTQVPPPPPVTGKLNFPVDVAQTPTSSNLTQNQTVVYPVAAPSTSARSSPDVSPMANGSDVHSTPSPNQSPAHSTSLPLTGEEHMSRAKLLELTSDGTQDHSLATERFEPTNNHLQQFTPADDMPVDCSQVYNDGDGQNAAIHARKLYIASTMICAQKQAKTSVITDDLSTAAYDF